MIAGAGAERLEWNQVRTLALVIEVLSPSTSRNDRFTKRRVYQELGVPVYWIIDLDQRRAEEWTPGATAPRYESARLTWHPTGATEPLVIELSTLFVDDAVPHDQAHDQRRRVHPGVSGETRGD